MADGQEEDFAQLPLPDRFTHKIWKVRKEGYEAAAKEFELTPDESDPTFRPFLQDPGLWKGAAADSNVAAQQEGLAALCAFLKYGGQQAAVRSRNYAIQPIYEKGLSSTRPAAKANAQEALLLYVELDKSEPVIEELLQALSHKQPKVIAASLAMITAIYHNFGCKLVDYKPVLKILPKAFGHADKNVRAEATNLTAELYRWLREAMKAVFWNDLKPVQQQDLEKLFEKVKEEPPPKQERLTRSQQAAIATATATAPEECGQVQGEPNDDEDVVEVDVFDIAEPIDVLSKVPSDFHENISSTKWKDRKDTLDALFNVFNTPRIKDGNFNDIVHSLAKCMKDANVAVVTVAANCVEKLATGVRNGFGKYRSTVMSPMLERFKEKKAAVAEALGAALDAVFSSTSLSDCLEETLTFLVHKNPQVKVETIKFLIRCLRTTRDVPQKAELKSIADAATKLLTESTENMRSGGAEILGTLMKIMGERALGPYLDGLDEIRKTKINEYFEAADVKAKDKPKPVVAPGKSANTSAIGKRVVGSSQKPGLKKAIPAVPPPAEVAAPSQPKPTAKLMSKLGGPAKPGSSLAPPSTMKLSGLKKPSGGTAASASSPLRRMISPPRSIAGGEEAMVPSPSKFAPGRVGLAGRPLSKPTIASPSPDLAPPAHTGLNAMERAELEELRSERERLATLAESLRSSNTKLTAEISELQNQNAQMIEDHTRDVLQIKAKETQLVRARGECDVLKSELESVRKEQERYKREVSRLGRESIGRERESVMQHRDESTGSLENGIYSDSSTLTANSKPASMLSRHGSGVSMARPAMGARPLSYMTTSPSEEKENVGESVFGQQRKISPPVAGFSSGRASPERPPPLYRTTTDGSDLNDNGEPAENWKRAAAVTNQLKARIAQMKVRYCTWSLVPLCSNADDVPRLGETRTLSHVFVEDRIHAGWLPL